MDKTDYCTFYPEGRWAECCWRHDHDCILAYEYRSAEMRLVGDIRLRKCVTAKGDGLNIVLKITYRLNAWVMFFGVRAWAIIKGGY
jgi:hypothetical protein